MPPGAGDTREEEVGYLGCATLLEVPEVAPVTGFLAAAADAVLFELAAAVGFRVVGAGLLMTADELLLSLPAAAAVVGANVFLLVLAGWATDVDFEEVAAAVTGLA